MEQNVKSLNNPTYTWSWVQILYQLHWRPTTAAAGDAFTCTNPVKDNEGAFGCHGRKKQDDWKLQAWAPGTAGLPKTEAGPGQESASPDPTPSRQANAKSQARPSTAQGGVGRSVER